MAQRDRMTEAMFTIGPEGKRTLELLRAETVVLERKPPLQREHFTAINDLRIAAELSGRLKYFYAAWELPRLGWKHAIIPDGLMASENMTVALEFDRGVEGVQFFVRTKMRVYERGLPHFTLSAVVVVVDRQSRLESLANAAGSGRCPVLFTTLDQIRGGNFNAPIFYMHPNRWGLRMQESIPYQTAPSSGEFTAPKSHITNSLVDLEAYLLSQERGQGEQ